jgi:hypothetical protein
MEENAHAASAKKQNKTRDKFLNAVAGCELPTRCLMAKSKKEHENVATPGRLLDRNGKGTSAPITRHTRINKPIITFQNIL